MEYLSENLEYLSENLTELILKYNFGSKGQPQIKEVIIKECLISVSQERNIISTPIDGRKGTIKEYISDSDYQITLDVGITNIDFYNIENNTKHQEYPLDKVSELVKFLRVEDTLIVSNDFLKLFRIYDFVVTGYTVPQETHSNRQSLNIKCISDAAFEIKIQNDKKGN